ncbi:sensor histidine kinase [uncultured Microbacterium sp.]|uniref:histidine kinase n=1 Tax=uncultured Microbacterium sp. TaxID=191216 RepID=A0A1Y5NXC2_9MICO|nr:sensor histidine kinase [uncultured Microbacterium sp.]SBS69950.1 putative GHKL domain protein [uncultured Microbacterium sp.]
MTAESTTLVRLRPYARLLTMLGEQLIKNDRIALTELVKNSYDADATRVQIRLDGFGPNLETLADSSITVIDNGIGMSADIVREHWLNPATNIKAEKKRKGESKTVGGRVIQGEKGIGRFAMFKLGSSVELRTRAEGEDLEVSTNLDIGFLDGGATPEASQELTYLDELRVPVTVHEPTRFTEVSTIGPHGTELIIRALRSTWSWSSLENLHQDLLRLRPLRQLLTGDAGVDQREFLIEYFVNGERPPSLKDPDELLENIAQHAVLKVVGDYRSASNSFVLTVNEQDRVLELGSDEIRGLELYRRVSKEREPHLFTSGDFSFELMVFDLRPSAEAEYQLNPVDKDLIKNHRIYLYRDGVRVLPYGDPDDDWLQLDTIRGTMGANRVLGNDQTIGFVYISQEDNPELRDKTNREGLIDSGGAYRDFLHLLQLLINYLRKGDFSRYLQESRQRSDAKKRRSIDALEQRLEEVRISVQDAPSAKRALDNFIAAYSIEREFMQARVEQSEDLAGVGLSVETASHDVIAASNQAYKDGLLLVQQLGGELGLGHDLTVRAKALSETLSFVVSRLQDVQGLFVSSRKRPKALSVAQYVKKIRSIYSRTLAEAGIDFEISGDENLDYVAHEPTLLQVFLNLTDNAVYWLRVADVAEPRITVTIDSKQREVIFRDNGPGIAALDMPYVFEPFFSAKGDEGRGLGLYIARQVAARDGLSLELVEEVEVDQRGRVPATFRLRGSE